MATPLERILIDHIRAHGPMGLDTYMSLCLAHPDHGYYTAPDKNPFGANGDFVTAPEISPLFGQILGLWAMDKWQSMGGPSPFYLVELGPGRGTLMADMMTMIRKNPAMMAAMRLVMVEVSPHLRTLQAAALSAYRPTWVDHMGDVPEDAPIIVINNEFFDALPVRQFVRSADGWDEVVVGLGPLGDTLRLGRIEVHPSMTNLTNTSTFVIPEATAELSGIHSAAIGLLDNGSLPSQGRQRKSISEFIYNQIVLPDQMDVGDVVEISPARTAVADDLFARVAAQGGAALIIDYGYEARDGTPTVQAVRAHEKVDILDRPGDSDLTALVDFGALAHAALDAGCEVRGPVTQGDFLRSLGVGLLAEKVMAGSDPAMRENLLSGLRRLTHPDQMGVLFKVLEVSPLI